MPEQVFQKRQTAYKVEIQKILNSKYIKNEGFEPNYLEFGGEKISRINIMGTVVMKSDLDNQNTLTIDDGTGKISARVFENNISLDKVDVSDIVLIIGKPREFSSEKYILIETIKKINPSWAKVRKLELGNKTKGTFNQKINDEPKKEDVIDLNPHNKIFALIKELDKGDGVSIEELSSRNIKDLDKKLNTLLKEGDIFEVRPGKIKVLE